MQKDVQTSLAIATVPMQEWGSVYEAETAFEKGTIFPALYKPFYATEPMADMLMQQNSSQAKDPCQAEREQLLKKICQVSFFLDDLTLYLDTHTQDQEAIRLYAEKGKERSELLSTFAERFFPLTRDCISKCTKAAEEYLWEKGPIPWEGACV